MSLRVAPSFGFPQRDDPETVLFCDCKSLAAVTAAGGAQQGAGAFNYNDSGVLLSATSGIAFSGLTTAQKAALANGGTLTCWVESGWIDRGRIPASHEYLIGANAGGATYYSVARPLGQPFLSCFLNNTTPAGAYRIEERTDTRGDYVRIDFTSNGPTGLPTVFVDYVPVTAHSTQKWPVDPAVFANIVLGGRTGTPTGPVGFRVKDVMVSTKPIVIPAHYALRRVCVFGHSYMSLGDYSIAGLFLGTSVSTSIVSGSAALTPALHGKLFENNIGLGFNRIHNHAYGGQQLNSAHGFADQMATARATYGAIGTAIVMFGANEAGSTANPWISEYGPGGTSYDWQAAFQTHITNLISYGADKILLLNQPYFSSSHATYSALLYRDRVDGLNTMIANLVAANPTCHLVDVWGLFGGAASYAPSNWGGFDGTDQSHPSLAMSRLIGRLCGQKLYTLL